jgi:hypothetical protein
MKRYTSNKVFHQKWRMSPILPLLYYLIAATFSAAGQTTLPGIAPDGSLRYPDEAPEELFSYTLGDAEVDFFLIGDWQARLGFAAGLTWIPEAGGGFRVLPYPPSDFATTPLSNEVDLVVSLWIDNHYFFESSFRSEFTDNSILAGYYGDGVLREFKLGNTDIGIATYPYFTLSDGITGSPGMSAVLAGPSSVHDFMIRYETSSERRRSFSGEREYSAERLNIGEFVRGKYFLLPDRNLDFLTVYLEADRFEDGFGEDSLADATGKWYRRLAEGTDYGFDDDSGELNLSLTLPEGRILVYYEKTGAPVGSFDGEVPLYNLTVGGSVDSASPILFRFGAGFATFVSSLDDALGNPGLTESDFQRSIEGATALLLYEPGVFSPFEIQSYYLDGQGEPEVFLIDAAGESIRLNSARRNGGFQILPDSSWNATVDPWKLRYPLLDVGARSDIARAYGPRASAAAESAGPDVFWLEVSTELGSGFAIGEEIIPGSLRVYRNGVLTNDFEYDGSTVIFEDEPSAYDDISISYRVLDDSGQSGNIIAAQGNRFDLGEAGIATVAVAGSVGVEQKQFSEIAGNNPGYLQLSAGYEYAGERFSVSLEAGAGLFTADTRGEYRPSARDPSDWSPGMGTANLFPSALPEAEQIENAPSSVIPAADLIEANRALPVYRDYRDNFRGFLLPRDAYASGSEPDPVSDAVGPYPVLADEGDPAEGVLAAMEFNLGAGEWAGYQYYPENDAPGLLSGYILRMLPDQLSGTVHIALQFGAIGEDLDGDNVLDAQDSPDDLGFEFDPSGVSYLAGYPGREYLEGWEGYSEDADGDGLLEPNRSGGIVTRYIGSFTAAGVWTEASTPLSDSFTAEELRRLGPRPGVRVIIYSAGGSAGKIYFSRVDFTRSAVIAHGQGARVSTAADGWRLNWSDTADAELLIDLGAAPSGIYRTLEFTIDPLSDAPDPVAISVNDIDLANFTPALSNETYTVRIDFAGRTTKLLDSAGSAVESADFPAGFDPETLNYLSLNLPANIAGDLAVGRPIFSDASSYLAGSLRSAMDFRPADLIAAAGTPLETGITRIAVESNVSTGGMGPGRGLDNRLTLEGRLPLSDVRLNSAVDWDLEDRVTGGLSHEIIVAPVPAVSLRNRFDYYLDDTRRAPRLNNIYSLAISPADFLDLGGEYAIGENASIRNRSWSGLLGLALTGASQAGSEPAPGTFSTDIRADFSQDEEQETGTWRPIGSFDYFGDYADSLLLLARVQSVSPDIRRTSAYGLALGGGKSPWSAGIDLELSSEYRSAPFGSLSSGANQEIEFGLAPGPLVSLTLKAGQVSQVTGPGGSPGFGGDVYLTGARIAGAPILAIPQYGYGVFAENSAQRFFQALESGGALEGSDNAGMAHTVSAGFSRRPGSSAADLAIPALVEIELRRNLTWQQDLRGDVRSATALAGWQAVNLFGSLGRYRTFSWYNSDEIYLEQRYSQNLSEAGDWSLATRIEPSLFDAGDIERFDIRFGFGYANRGTSSVQLSVTGDLNWTAEIRPGSAFEEFLTENSRLEPELALENRESVTLRYTGFRRDGAAGSNLISEKPGFLLLLSHDSSLRFSDLGKLTASGKIAYENRAIPEINYRFSHTIGFQIDALLELSY